MTTVTQVGAATIATSATTVTVHQVRVERLSTFVRTRVARPAAVQAARIRKGHGKDAQTRDKNALTTSTIIAAFKYLSSMKYHGSLRMNSKKTVRVCFSYETWVSGSLSR